MAAPLYLPLQNGAWKSRAVLAAAAVTVLLFVAITLSPLRSGFADAPNRGPGDVGLYRAEVDRIHAGEGYYSAIASELRARGYPTRSLFNWRMPLPVWLIGKAPDPTAAKVLLCAAALALLVLSFGWLADEQSIAQGVFGGLLLTGALLPCLIGDLFVMPEVWCGVFIALSIAAYGAGRRRIGLAVAVLALFFRELAAPYYVLCLALSLYERRWKEVGVWFAAFAAYLAYFLVHASNVLPLIDAADRAHEHGWIRFGGAAFVIATSQMNVYLLLLPQWVTAIYLAMALVGFGCWHSGAGQRAGITAAMYLAAFSIIGQEFNQYWGSITAPLLCLGVARAPAALGQLWRAAFQPLPAAAE